MSEPPDTASPASRDASSAADATGDTVFALVYDELRRLAATALRHERPDHTLQPTALVHEAYLRLADEPGARWESRGHFLAVAARAMRRILVDHARGRKAAKRGSGAHRLSLDDVEAAGAAFEDTIDLVALDEALKRLADLDQRQARIIELRFFAGLSVEETAEIVGASTRTVKRDWQFARAWLKREMARLSTT